MTIPESQPPEDSEGTLDRLARAIDERRAVDWEREVELHPNQAAAIRALQEMDRMASAHEEIRRTMPVEPEDDLTGTRLSHYRILERVMAGGMGVVYRARDERLERDVALKVLHREVGTGRGRDRLLAEARLACAISHPHLAAIYDVGESGDRIFFAMEWVDGAVLSEEVHRKPFAPDRVVEFGAQIASALQAIHEKGIVHCDVKSLNIRITPAGVAKLLDFGIAFRSAAENADTPERQSVSGTIPYMAPETLSGGRPDARSDVWSLGVTLYEAVSGRLPFHGDTRERVIEAILRGEPAPLDASIPHALRRLIDRCLRRDPAERYANGGEAYTALDALRPSHRLAASRRVTAATLAVFVVAVALMTIWIASRADRSAGSLAIWPVRNTSGAPDQEFLAEGLTNQLLTTFARFESIRILSRESSDAMVRAARPLPELARDYRLDYVLRTSVRRRDDRIEVSSMLVDARKGGTVWSQTYDRPLRDIAVIDREIARAVAAKLESDQAGRLPGNTRPTIDLAAYEAYVKGRESAAARQYHRALVHYADAIRRDSTFAAAHAAIADCNAEMLYYGMTPAAEGLERATAAARRALELDPNQASPHLALAMVHGLEWEWSRAEREIDLALLEEPGNAEVWYRRSLYFGVIGDRAEHAESMERAAALDPLSPRLAVELGLAYLNAGKVDKAAEQFRRAAQADLGDESRRARAYGARCLVLKGKYRKAITELTADVASPPAVFEQEELAYAYAKAGLAAQAKESLRSLQLAGVAVSPLSIAAVQVGLGDRDAALATLTAAAEHREPRIIWVQVDQRFDPLRRDPRYASLLATMGLAEGAAGRR